MRARSMNVHSFTEGCWLAEASFGYHAALMRLDILKQFFP